MGIEIGNSSIPMSIVMFSCSVSVIRDCCPLGISVRLMDDKAVSDLKVSPNCLEAASQVSHA